MFRCAACGKRVQNNCLVHLDLAHDFKKFVTCVVILERIRQTPARLLVAVVKLQKYSMNWEFVHAFQAQDYLNKGLKHEWN